MVVVMIDTKHVTTDPTVCHINLLTDDASGLLTDQH